MVARALTRSVFLVLFLAFGALGTAHGQPSAAPAKQDLGAILEQAHTAGVVLRDDKTLPDSLRPTVDSLNTQLDQARELARSDNRWERNYAMWGLLGLTLVFLLLSAVALATLALKTQKIFWAATASRVPPEDAWRNYLMQLPLGAPEGSIRGLISFYVIVFGLLVLIFQNQLGLQNVEVIAGFIGIVITFYFTARTTDQANKAVNSAVDAAKQATEQVTTAVAQTRTQVGDAVQAAKDAATHAQGAADAAQTASNTANQITGQISAASGGPDPQIAHAQSGLQTVKDGLQTATQVIGALGSLGVGTGILANAGALTKTAGGLLDAIDPLLSGSPSVANIGEVMGKAQTALDGLDNAGLPGVLGDAIAGISGTLGALAPIVSGISGGPAGIVFGIVMSGIKLLQQKEKFDAWKAALLRTPMNRALMPATVDGTVALAALDPTVSPLMSARLGTVPPAFATELMRAMLRTGPSGDPLPAATLATELFAPGQELGLHDKFKDEKELAEAITEYRGGIVFVNARAQLQGNIDIPAGGGQPASSINLGSLLTSAVKLGTDPRSASDIERLVYVVEALGKLGLGPDKLVGLAQVALTKGMDLSRINRQQADQQQ
jgi:hypothetical protein